MPASQEVVQLVVDAVHVVGSAEQINPRGRAVDMLDRAVPRSVDLLKIARQMFHIGPSFDHLMEMLRLIREFRNRIAQAGLAASESLRRVPQVVRFVFQDMSVSGD